MNKKAKKILSVLLAFAMVITGAAATMVSGQLASAAKKPKVTLKLNKSSLSLKKGKSSTLKITKKNVTKIKSQKWTTSKKTVATVSQKGKVTAKKAGKATIKVKVSYIAKGMKKAKTKTLSCKVTVTDSTPAPTKRPAPSYSSYDDKSNIGPEREVTIKGGTSDKMKIKDNGTMRTNLSSQDLADWYMGIGINLGNTMEATAASLQEKEAATEATYFETAWGNAVTTQKYIDCVHSYGINTIRIPVAWSNMVNEETYEINDKYLGRVEEIVNYALNDGMYAIINIHWDSQWWGQFGACKRLEDNSRVADEERRAQAWKRFESYWKQISERFKNYSDHLIFEGANEELCNRLNDPIYQSGYVIPYDKEKDPTPISGNLTKAEQYETTNKINQLFVDTVRASGGNNKNRHLLIAGFATNIDQTADMQYKMPTDIAENGKSKLFVSVHYYTPWDFCGDDGTGTYDEEDRQALAKYFAPMQRFVDEGYAIILGECGVCEPISVTGDVPQWFRDTFAEAQKYHMVPVMWEKGQYFNRAEGKLKFKDMAEMFNDITGAKGDTSMDRLTGKQNAPAIDTVDVSKKTPVWSWSGKWYKNGGDSVVGDDRYQEGGGTVVDGNDPDKRSKFVPESKITPTIEGDTTEIFFNEWGYQAFLKLDLSKYKKPAILFKFLENTDNDGNVGALQIGATTAADKFVADFSIDFYNINGKAVVLSDNVGLSADKPWLSISFGSKPTVTGIEVYEMGE